MQTQIKRTGIVLLISKELALITNTISDKQEYYIMIKGIIILRRHIILNLYTSENRLSKFMMQKAVRNERRNRQIHKDDTLRHFFKKAQWM